MFKISKKIKSFFNRPVVSVILASYNHVDYIEKAVRSVLDQSVTSIELIVVDDGSTDGTVEKIEKIIDPRLRLIKLRENRRYHPRNMALKIAQGKYIAFQNSDDEWEKDKLKEQIAVLEKNLTLSACFTDVEIIDKNGNQLKESWANGLFTRKNRHSQAWLRRFFNHGNCLCISSALIRRKSFQKVGYFNPCLIQLSDFDLWVRLVAVGNFYIIDSQLTRMRVVDNRNVSSPSPLAMHRSNIEFMETLNNFKKPPILGQISNVFRNVLKKQGGSDTINLGGLVLHAWTLSPIHIFWGNQTMAELLRNDSRREELVGFYGIDIVHKYIQKRGEIEISLASS